jgi:hypothetical protein
MSQGATRRAVNESSPAGSEVVPSAQPAGGPRLRPGKEVEQHEDAASGISPKGDHSFLHGNPTNTTWRNNDTSKPIQGFQKNAPEKKKK